MEHLPLENKSICTRMELFQIWLEKAGSENQIRNKHVQTVVCSRFEENECTEADVKLIKDDLSRFCSKLGKLWNEAKRNKEYFLKKNKTWLEQTISLKVSGHEIEIERPSTSRAGRPAVSFEDSSERSKRRRTQEMRKKLDLKELTYATKMKLRAEGKIDAAKLLSEAVDATPSRAKSIREAWISHDKHKPIPYTPEEALCLIVETNLTKSQYMTLRLQAKEKRANIYPSYHNIKRAKEECYPDRSSIIISDLMTEVKLQALLDHTSSRIVESQRCVFETADTVPHELILISKWGCDGSTGHSEYKQKIEESSSDNAMFLSSLVPLQLFALNENSEKWIFWQNPRPSSVRYCRPIRIQYAKETLELTKNEVDYIENQIKDLEATKITTGGRNILVKHELILTMVDGKICNALTSTESAQTCYVCGAKPSEMNNLKAVGKKDVDITTYRFGLSTLHAWIRFFECLLHVSYRLEFKQWQARGEKITTLLAKKMEIQKKFKKEMGLLVDHVKPGGSGTTNDGNTARRFFRDPETAARITGIDVYLIRRFAVILQTLSSGYKLNNEKFDAYAKETANLFVTNYGWYYMPASVHKILIHGAEIVESAMLPIGQLSEEAQESRNKDLKQYRRSHTRKSSRQLTNEDLLHCLLISSDPYITGLRKLPQNRSTTLPSEVLSLLATPEVSTSSATWITQTPQESTSETTTSDDDIDSESSD